MPVTWMALGLTRSIVAVDSGLARVLRVAGAMMTAAPEARAVRNGVLLRMGCHDVSSGLSARLACIANRDRSMKTSQAFPGMSSPAAGFDEPFEMLASCHDRVRRSLALLERLCVHVRERGVDAQAAAAAADVLRYFSIAAPQHHQDEERHVVPMLRRLGDAQSLATADRIVTDHARLHTAWAVLEPQLRVLQSAHHSASTSGTASASNAGPFGAIGPLEASAREFIELHTEHLALEEAVAFPAAAAVVARQGAAALRAMGAEMAARRGVPNPGSAG